MRSKTQKNSRSTKTLRSKLILKTLVSLRLKEKPRMSLKWSSLMASKCRVSSRMISKWKTRQT